MMTTENSEKSLEEIREPDSLNLDHGRFLEETARNLIHIGNVSELFDFTGNQLTKLTRNKGIIAITEHEGETWRIRKIAGLPSIVENVFRIVKIDVHNLSGPINQNLKQDLLSKKLVSRKLSVDEYFSRSTAKLLPKNVFQKIGLGYLKVINLTHHGKGLGNISFLLKKEDDLNEFRTLIESFCDLISVSLDRIIAEEELRKSEQNYRVLAEETQEYIMRFDRNAKLLYVNESIQRDWGHTEGELLGKDFIEILGDIEFSRSSKQLIEEVVKEKKSVSKIVDSSSGDEKSFLDWRLYPVFDKDQEKVESVLSMSRDITDRIKSESVLKQINDRLKNTIENVPGAVYREQVTPDYQLNFISQQVSLLSGYSPTDFYKNKVELRGLVNPSDLGSVKSAVKHATQNKTKYEFSYRIKTKNNKEKWVWEKGVVVTSDDEVFREGFIMDITDRVRQDDRIIAATLEAEDSERNRISAEIHDGVQQTLVSSLMKFQDLQKRIQSKIEDEDVKERFKEAIKVLQDGVTETRGIAHSIMPKSIKDFGFIKTIESMVNVMQENTQINYAFYHNFDHRLKGNIETSFYRIVQESVNNINKYSKATEVNIQLIKNEDYIVLTIDDNGVGFDITEQSLLYSGLGISYMKSRANSVGADFEINSKPGKGTTVVVEIPIKKLEEILE